VRILLAEDDRQLRESIARGLREASYAVDDAPDGAKALFLAAVNDYDAIVLDIVLPEKDGLEVCRQIRRKGIHAPILMLTARDTVEDKITGLDAGADDYVTKPFGIQELLARIRAAMRRAPGSTEQGPRTVRTEDLEIDFDARTASVAGKSVRLTPKEFDLLRYLVLNGNKAVPHRKLLQAVWGPDYGDEVEYLRVFINALRKKVEPNPSKPKYLVTEPWVGYRFAVPEAEATKP
jgi:two-component system KDP operon response regulator KdpE